MREIKFRVWNKFYEKFIRGFEWDIVQGVKPERDIIIEQYTGLKDKNGKEIYEGDIINPITPRKSGYPGQIIWAKNARFSVLWKDQCRGLDSGSTRHWEVIGNIHQNPELLLDIEE